MNRGMLFLSVIAFFSSYLILSLPFISAMAIGDAMEDPSGEGSKIAFGEFDPSLTIIDDIPPVECGDSGTIRFRMYFENVPENVRIRDIDAHLSNTGTGERYSIGPAVTCSYGSAIVSNQMITCTIDKGKMEMSLPQCPLRYVGNIFELKVTYEDQSDVRTLSATKGMIITEKGLSPSMRIYWDVFSGEQRLKESRVNCETGSIIRVPLLIDHAEVLQGNMHWSFTLQGKEYGPGSIDCELAYPGTLASEGRSDIYTCDLMIPSSLIPDCIPNTQADVGIRLINGEFDMTGETQVTLYEEPLVMGMQITEYPSNAECQIITYEGACIPRDPQRTVRLRITGNIPERVKVFDFRYSLDGGDPSATICERTSGDSHVYECPIFLPVVSLEGPEDPDDPEMVFTGSQKLNLSVNTQFLNHYNMFHDSKTIHYKGEIYDDTVDRMKAIGKHKGIIKWIMNNYKEIMLSIRVLKNLVCCCSLSDFIGTVGGAVADVTIEKIVEEGLAEGAVVFAESLWIVIESEMTTTVLISIFADLGIEGVECYLEAQMDVLDDAMETLEDFEGDDFTLKEISDKPCREGSTIDKVKCWLDIFGCALENTAKKVLDSLTCGVWGCFSDCAKGLGTLCFATGKCSVGRCWECLGSILGCIALITTLVLTGTASAAGKICSYVLMGLNVSSVLIGFIFLWVSTSDTQDYFDLSMAQMEKRMEVQGDFQVSMQDHVESQQGFFEGIANRTRIFSLFGSGFRMPTASVFFRSASSGSLLKYNETVYSGESFYIDYDVKRMNLSHVDVGELTITRPDGSPPSLVLPDVNGTIGPYDPDNVFTVSPGYHPSGEYDFVMDYTYGFASYRLNYENGTRDLT